MVVLLERSAAYDLAQEVADEFMVAAETIEAATGHDQALGKTLTEKISLATRDTQFIDGPAYQVVVLIRRLANVLGSRNEPATDRTEPSRQNFVDAIAMLLCSPPGGAIPTALREQKKAAMTCHKRF